MGGGAESVNTADEGPWSCCAYMMYFGFRILIIVIIAGLAFLIPNINILLTFCGAVLGTIVNIWLPVLFYNRAYTFSDKNKALEGEEGIKEEESDPRYWTKCASWTVLVLGTILGLVGLGYAIYELVSGTAKKESAD
jgi:hypothetical protein